MSYEYKCVPAPSRPKKRSRRAKTPSERIALAMEQMIQEQATDGWEYMRADLVQVMEKPGFFSRPQEIHRTVLVFRRSTEPERGQGDMDLRPYDEDDFEVASTRSRRGLRRGDQGRGVLKTRDEEDESRHRQEEPLRVGEEDRIDPGRPAGSRRPPSGLG